MVSRFAYVPVAGATVLFDGEVWTVWAQAPAAGSWWLLPYRPDSTEAPSQKDAVIAKQRDITPYRVGDK